MQLGLTTFVSTLLLGSAAAVDLYFYQYATTCGGPALWSVYGANNAQCYTGGNVMSIGVQYVPSGAKVQAYRGNGCGNYAGEGGAGYSCLSGGTLNSANWFYPFKKLVRKTPEAEPRFSVTYEQPGGTVREIEVRSGHVERTLKLVEKRDYEALQEFPTFVKRDIELESSSA